mmetsp:Transcript_29102/g.48112  ORF Transcript_29102/g.48112 Transcript_29102/m.48112 type:complete len:431 (-) Transcript_29102:112-1404(-)|eukprot:CAMPEP_0119009818 /NCGR_PEP_ID=MMETSP1176-20130426/4620_1 /TAXON_ID=265551 /ORGANISM="Synedropsis recta cf, Strain CCMP1620" /LENGTH=430 /DNA_ID=CAMNT_0006962397 /DNA_START=102 /DNA_END=1394 /DNA_ORIENTATION=-
MMRRFRSEKSNYTNGSDDFDGDDASSHYGGSCVSEETREIYYQRNVQEVRNKNVTEESIPEAELAGEEIDLETFAQVALADKVEEVVDNEEPEEEASKRRSPLGLKLCSIAFVVVCCLLAVFLAVYLTVWKDDDTSAPDITEKSGVTEVEVVAPTLSPSKSPYGYILDILGDYTDEDVLTDDTTPQGQAFLQLVMEEDAASNPTSAFRITQRYALATLHLSTEPDSWVTSFGWNGFTANECTWYGLGPCEETSDGMAVTELFLSSNGLSGAIPEEICLLENLERLSLGENFIFGTLPQCLGGYSKLKSLKVQGNEITGALPTGLLTIATLVEVDISDNRFDGTLDVLFEGSKTLPAGLKIFNANENWLTGTIPVAFGFLPSLQSLKLQDNQFKAGMPVSVCNLNTAFGTNGQFIVDCVIDCSCCVHMNCS